MRANRFIVAAAFAATLLAILAAGQLLTNNEAVAAILISPGSPNAQFVPFPSGKIGLLASGTNALQLTNFLAGPRLGRLNGLSPAAPTPGVYKTEPYACIVVVPGKHPDDCSIVKPSESGDKMPEMRPELRLVPFHPK